MEKFDRIYRIFQDDGMEDEGIPVWTPTLPRTEQGAKCGIENTEHRMKEIRTAREYARPTGQRNIEHSI
jgi:hypothetical protein